MKNLIEFVQDINELAQYYDMKNFQEIRKRLHPNTHIYKDLFPFRNIDKDEGYAYNNGGQKELQFNIALDKEKAEFRYGIAFCLKPDRNFRDPLNTLKPKILRLNQFITKTPNIFEDMKFWAYQEPEGPTLMGPQKVVPIPRDLIRNNVFLFWGKFASWEKVQPEHVLRLLSRLLPVYEYVEGNAKKSTQQGEILFEPGFNPGPEQTIAHKKSEVKEINLWHNSLAEKIYSALEKKYGQGNVGHNKSGPRVDIVVREGETYTYYEIKTSDDIKACIREALGQLLEYSYWPAGREAKSLVIVTENSITSEAQKYLNILRERFGLPVYYQTFDMESETLGEMN